jgi:uncharacterized glyoxalase superfamily protein PhnB
MEMQKKRSIFTNQYLAENSQKLCVLKNYQALNFQWQKIDANKIMHIALPIADSPWGSYFGMFRDKYGIEWIVDFDPKQNG